MLHSPTPRSADLPRELACALALAALALPGLWPAPRQPDPLLLLVWLAWIAPAAGWAAGALRLHALVLVPLPLACWAALVHFAAQAGGRELPQPWAALAVVCGFYLSAVGLARLLAAERAGEAAAGAAALLALGALLGGLPTTGALGAAPWPPALAARLFDLSPPALVAECAGIDWLRQPGIYSAAGSAHLTPSLRRPYRGALAGPGVLVVGCALASLGIALDRRRRSLASAARGGPAHGGEERASESPCRAESTSAPSRSS